MQRSVEQWFRDLQDQIGHSLYIFRQTIDARMVQVPYMLNRIEQEHSRQRIGRLPKASISNGLGFLNDRREHPSDGFQKNGNGGPLNFQGNTSNSSAVTRDDIGRATWLVLHTIAAQYPEKPTRQQKRDAKNFMNALSHLYPCAECAEHFQSIVKSHPPEVGSREEFSRWMCQVHNTVNRSLGKPTFNCDLVLSRWSGMECGEDNPCEVAVGSSRKSVVRNVRKF